MIESMFICLVMFSGAEHCFDLILPTETVEALQINGTEPDDDDETD